MKRTVTPSAEIEARISELLAAGVAASGSQETLTELASLGAKLIIQRAVEEEFDGWLGRARYERKPGAAPGKRNGWRPRRLQTAEGELRVEIPQVREAPEPFVSTLFPVGRRILRTEPLKAMVIGAFVRGLSMRDVESLCESSGLAKVTKSTASRICKELRARYLAFRQRDLSQQRLVALFLDAIYLPTRPAGRKEGVLCAWGFERSGRRVLLDVCLGMRESEEDWLALGRGLHRRGLPAPLLVVSDGAPGLITATEQLWPRADRQRCTVHRLRNVVAKLPCSERIRFKAEYWRALDRASDPDDGARLLRELIGKLADQGYASPPAAWPTISTRSASTSNTRCDTAANGAPPTSSSAHSARSNAAPKDRTLPRREQLPIALLGSARPRRRTLQRPHVHRTRTPNHRTHRPQTNPRRRRKGASRID